MRAYRWLLHLYPRAFRAAYGAEMAAITAKRLASTSGAGRLVAWAAAVGDLLANAARVQADVTRHDVRDALRQARRHPMFAATAVALAAVGIGAGAAAIALVDHVLLRPLPFAEPDRLVKLWQDQASQGYSRMELSPGNLRDWMEGSRSFSGVAAYTGRSATLLGAGEPVRLDGTATMPSLFSVLGVPAALGRTLAASDGQADAAAVAVLSDAAWRRHFGADPGVVGRTVSLDDGPHVVIGVMPAWFLFPERTTEFWTALRLPPAAYEDRGDTYLRVVARLAPGVTIAQARQDLGRIAARLAEAYPEANEAVGANVVTLRDEVAQQPRVLLAVLGMASIALLLVTSLNLAGLLLGRGLDRQQEVAVRLALGAGRERVARQLVTEHALLAAGGGLLGVGLAAVFAPRAAALVPTALPIAAQPHLDWRLLAWAVAGTLVSAALAGLLPVGHTVRIAGGAALGGARAGRAPAAERVRAGFVVGQIAATVALVAVTLLLLRALVAVQRVDPGFDPSGVVTLRTTLPLPKYAATARREAFYRDVLDATRRQPGVEAAAYISFLPMVMRGGIWQVTVPDGEPVPESARTASLRLVTPGFFAAVGTPLLDGRDVSPSDGPEAADVAVVSRAFARRYWPDRSPLGRRVQLPLGEFTVVGVVGDIRVRGLERQSEPQVYLASSQVADGALVFYMPKDLVVRSTVSPATLVPALRRIVAAADPAQPVSDVQTLAAVVAADTAPRRTQVQALAVFAAVAVTVAAIGLHALLAFGVQARAREIGIRLALGAGRQHVLRLVAVRAAALGLVGTVAGLAIGYTAARLLQSQLAGLGPADAVAFAAAAVLGGVMTLSGSLRPAWRALEVDPVVVMRAE